MTVAGSVKGNGEIEKLIIKFDRAGRTVNDAVEEMRETLQGLYGDQFVNKTDPYGNAWPTSSNPNTMVKSGDLAAWTFQKHGREVTMQQPKQGVMQDRGLPRAGGGFDGAPLLNPNPALKGNKPRPSLPWDGSDGVWQAPVQEAIDSVIGKWLKE